MKREIYFCDGWFIRRKRATKLLTRDEAFALHEKGKDYTVLIDSDIKPTIGLNVIKDDYVGVFFFDDQQRDYLWYQFQMSKKYPGKLFLSFKQKREYIGDSFEVKHNEIYQFKEDGHVYVEDRIPLHDEKQTVDVISYEKMLDLPDLYDSNYVDFPSFGEYEELIKNKVECLDLKNPRTLYFKN